MAVPDTTNVTRMFVTRAPAWERGVDLEQVMSSDVQSSRAGLEQRQSRMSRGKWKIGYSAYLNAGEAKARKLRSLYEICAPLIVPFWCEAGVTATAIISDTVSIDRASSLDFFAPGQFVFFEHLTMGAEFREIDSIGATDQELVLTALPGAIAFPAGTRVYPCRECIRDGGQAQFEIASEHTYLERLAYSTL